jgi:K+-sensing histidine kinase KdpD
VQRLHAVLSDAMRLEVLRRMRGTVHHDFVSPLQATTLTLDLLRRQLQQPQTDADRERTLQLIEGGKAELGRFRNGVANVMDTLGASERKRRVDIGQLVELLGAWMKNEAAFLGLQLEVQQSAEQVVVDGAFEEVRQVLAILMLHAIDSLASGGRLRVAIRKDGRWAQVNLAAEGLKESAQCGPQLFEPNWGEPSALLGLGPYVARFSAVSLGGELTAEPGAARNAVLKLRLPLAG